MEDALTNYRNGNDDCFERFSGIGFLAGFVFIHACCLCYTALGYTKVADHFGVTENGKCVRFAAVI